MKKDNKYSMSLGRANLISLALFFPLSLLLLAPYVITWGWTKTGSDLLIFYDNGMLFIVLVLLGIVGHELIHGVTWMWFGRKSWSTIKFGINWKALAPYAHCREPLEISAYRWGAVMPAVILGIIPFIMGLITGNGWFILFGYLFFITASGDFLILWLVRNLGPGTMVLDHPTRAGCRVAEKEMV